jgi:hypothetical protein
LPVATSSFTTQAAAAGSLHRDSTDPAAMRTSGPGCAVITACQHATVCCRLAQRLNVLLQTTLPTVVNCRIFERGAGSRDSACGCRGGGRYAAAMQAHSGGRP